MTERLILAIHESSAHGLAVPGRHSQSRCAAVTMVRQDIPCGGPAGAESPPPTPPAADSGDEHQSTIGSLPPTRLHLDIQQGPETGPLRQPGTRQCRLGGPHRLPVLPGRRRGSPGTPRRHPAATLSRRWWWTAATAGWWRSEPSSPTSAQPAPSSPSAWSVYSCRSCSKSAPPRSASSQA